MRLLITGINGYICDDCAEQAYQIVRENLKEQQPAKKGRGSNTCGVDPVAQAARPAAPTRRATGGMPTGDGRGAGSHAHAHQGGPRVITTPTPHGSLLRGVSPSHWPQRGTTSSFPPASCKPR